MQKQEITFTVPRICCSGCCETIAGVLGEMGGVEEVEVELQSKRVRLQVDPEMTSPEAISLQLTEIGFPPEK